LAAIDCDGNVFGTQLMQYVYSHDNEGGFMMAWGGSWGNQTDAWIIRDCISVNDGMYSPNMGVYKIGWGNMFMYNNVFYNDQGKQIRLSDEDGRGSFKSYFINNIFASNANTDYVNDLNRRGRFQYINNCYYGRDGALLLRPDGLFRRPDVPGADRHRLWRHIQACHDRRHCLQRQRPAQVPGSL